MNRPRTTRNFALGSLELLDDRIVPSATGITALPVATQEAFVADRGGQALGTIYTQYVNYEQAGTQGTFSSTLSGQVFLSGSSVGVSMQFNGGDFNTLLGQLEGIGMKVTASLPQDNFVEGYLPISELPVVASNGYVTNITPVYEPIARTASGTPATSGGSTLTATDEALVSNKGGASLGGIYTQYVNYEEAGAQGTFTSTFSNQVQISGTSVGVDITFSGGDFNTLVGQLEGIGMQVTATSTQNGIVEGYLPIGQLPVVASNGYVTGLSPIYRPVVH